MKTNLSLSLLIVYVLLPVEAREKGDGGLRRNLKKSDDDDDDYYDYGVVGGGGGIDFSIQGTGNQEQQLHACLPFSQVPLRILQNPTTHRECLDEGGCGEGCCRIHNNAECIAFEPVLPGQPGSTILPCICNGNTGSPEDFAGPVNETPSIVVDPANENPSVVVIEPPVIVAPVIPNDPPVEISDTTQTADGEESSTEGQRCHRVYDTLEGIGERCESNDSCGNSDYCCTKNFCVCANVGKARNFCM